MAGRWFGRFIPVWVLVFSSHVTAHLSLRQGAISLRRHQFCGNDIHGCI